MNEPKIKPCQHCGDAWVDESDEELHGYRIVCTCGHAQNTVRSWFMTEEDAIKAWNEIADRW